MTTGWSLVIEKKEEHMSDRSRCDTEGPCWALGKVLRQDGAGFRSILMLNKRPQKCEPMTKWVGVAFYASAHGTGTALNFCPWCGGKPGAVAKCGGQSR